MIHIFSVFFGQNINSTASLCAVLAFTIFFTFFHKLYLEFVSKIHKPTANVLLYMLFRSFIEVPINNKISINNSDTGVHYWKIKNGNKEIVYTNKNEHIRNIK